MDFGNGVIVKIYKSSVDLILVGERLRRPQTKMGISSGPSLSLAWPSSAPACSFFISFEFDRRSKSHSFVGYSEDVQNKIRANLFFFSHFNLLLKEAVRFSMIARYIESFLKELLSSGLFHSTHSSRKIENWKDLYQVFLGIYLCKRLTVEYKGIT